MLSLGRRLARGALAVLVILTSHVPQDCSRRSRSPILGKLWELSYLRLEMMTNLPEKAGR